MTTIDFKDVTFSYSARNQSIPAIRDVNLHIRSGEFAALIGPSGCGKSTLLKLAGGQLHPTFGSIQLNGGDPADLRTEHKIAALAQNPALLPWLTTEENINLARMFLNSNVPRIEVEESLRMVNLATAAKTYPKELSGGMQQRAALARLLASNAELWLMDEPFAAVDELNREELSSTLREIWEPIHPTVLWVTHNIPEALRLADRVLVFSPSPGRIIGDIPVDLPRPHNEADPRFHSIATSIRDLLRTSKNAEPN